MQTLTAAVAGKGDTMKATGAWVPAAIVKVLVSGSFVLVHVGYIRHAHTDANAMTAPALTLEIPAFQNNGTIPALYTCDGSGMSPRVLISGVPASARSLALIVHDPDVPKQVKPDGVFDHWVLYDIAPDTKEIPEGGSAGKLGKNGAGERAYAGPCPPPQYEPAQHRYIFTLYALDIGRLAVVEPPTKDDVLAAIAGHDIAQTRYVGLYKRS